MAKGGDGKKKHNAPVCSRPGYWAGIRAYCGVLGVSATSKSANVTDANEAQAARKKAKGKKRN
ncbi:MAG: hypothetical protein GTO63_07975 [Anaerolineae bacterium]|nr:hypothetical protein [Anaerolineae bacterium]NIN94867.1 hypothetical protein [Anaerolineae bacterium]NIQ77918.1 hypothetical protein [Anaerolineae bacterium]